MKDRIENEMVNPHSFMTAFVMALVVCGRATAGEPEASRAADSVRSQCVWQPKPATDGAEVRPARVRIVDFGTDFLRDGDGG